MSDETRRRQAERLALTQRRRLQRITIPPDPPRGVKFGGGTVTWEPPADVRNVTHFNLYVDSDSGPIERRVAIGQTRATAVYGDRVAMSSFNEASGLESRRVTASAGVLTGPPGAEYAPVVQGITATASDLAGEAGTQLFRVTGTITLPANTSNYGGSQIVGRIDGAAGLVLLADLDTAQTDYESVVLPKTTADQSWEVWARSYNSDRSALNTITPSTPKATFTVAKLAGTLDLARATSTSYDTIELEVAGGQFKVKNVNLRKAFNFNSAEFEIDPTQAFRVKAMVADKIQTGILSIGNPGGGQVSKAAFFSTTGKVYGFIGDDTAVSGFQGAAFRELRAGGVVDGSGNFNPFYAKFICDDQGNVTLKGATLSLGPGTNGDLGKIFLYSDTDVYGFWGVADVGESYAITTSVNGLVTTSVAHGRPVGSYVRISGHSFAGLNKIWKIATVPAANQLTVTGTVTGSGTGGVLDREMVGIYSREARFSGNDPGSAKMVAEGDSLSLFDCKIRVEDATADNFILIEDGIMYSENVSGGYATKIANGYIQVSRTTPGPVNITSEWKHNGFSITDEGGFTRFAWTYDNVNGFVLKMYGATGVEKVRFTQTGVNFLVPLAFGGSTAIDASKNAFFDACNAVSYKLGGTTIITSAGDASFNTLAVGSYSDVAATLTSLQSQINSLASGKANVVHSHSSISISGTSGGGVAAHFHSGTVS